MTCAFGATWLRPSAGNTRRGAPGCADPSAGGLCGARGSPCPSPGRPSSPPRPPWWLCRSPLGPGSKRGLLAGRTRGAWGPRGLGGPVRRLRERLRWHQRAEGRRGSWGWCPREMRAGPREGGAGGTHRLLRLGSCAPCCLRAGAGGAGAASPSPRTRGCAPPRPCRRRCTGRRAAACARTPGRAAAARGPGRHLPRGRRSQRRGAPGRSASAGPRAPGPRRSSRATGTAAGAPRPWRAPAAARPLRAWRGRGTFRATSARDGGGRDSGEPGRERRELRALPEPDAASRTSGADRPRPGRWLPGRADLSGTRARPGRGRLRVCPVLPARLVRSARPKRRAGGRRPRGAGAGAGAGRPRGAGAEAGAGRGPERGGGARLPLPGTGAAGAAARVLSVRVRACVCACACVCARVWRDASRLLLRARRPRPVPRRPRGPCYERRRGTGKPRPTSRGRERRGSRGGCRGEEGKGERGGRAGGRGVSPDPVESALVSGLRGAGGTRVRPAPSSPDAAEPTWAPASPRARPRWKWRSRTCAGRPGPPSGRSRRARLPQDEHTCESVFPEKSKRATPQPPPAASLPAGASPRAGGDPATAGGPGQALGSRILRPSPILPGLAAKWRFNDQRALCPALLAPEPPVVHDTPRAFFKQRPPPRRGSNRQLRGQARPYQPSQPRALHSL